MISGETEHQDGKTTTELDVQVGIWCEVLSWTYK